ncbi:MAG: ATP-binding protein, partial [Flavobacterium sp.]|nr:ATP-binding protein [Flavobacterium sp.]
YGQIPLISCYPGQLNQVFLNIINNSIQAIEGKGAIIISTKTEDNKLLISFKDNGKGISENIKKRIFEPFFTTKDVGKGTGLGLAISFGIIEKHKGTIEVNSLPDEGTEVIIQMPIK